MGRKTFSFDIDEDRWNNWKRTVPRDKALHERIKELLDADAEGRVSEGTASAEELVADDLTAVVSGLEHSMNETQADSLLVALEYLRRKGTAKTGEIAEAAMEAQPNVYADAGSWRSNLWNNVTGELQEKDVLELENKSRGQWRWVGE